MTVLWLYQRMSLLLEYKFSLFPSFIFHHHSMMPCKIRLFCVSDQIRRHIRVYDSSQHQPVTDLSAKQKAQNALRELTETAGVPNTLRESVFTPPPILPDLCLPSVYFPLHKYRLNIFNRTYDETVELFLEQCPVIICEYNYRHPFYTSSLCKKMSSNISSGAMWETRWKKRQWQNLAQMNNTRRGDDTSRWVGTVGVDIRMHLLGSTLGFYRESPAYIICVSH